MTSNDLQSDAKSRPIRRLATLCALALLVAVAGCGSDGSDNSTSPDYAAAIGDAPAPLARLYADGDAILDGGQKAYEGKLKSVRGYPVVVNNWASWCMPCRDEFPHFQEMAAKYLDRVAFLGVDSEDSRDAAESFLRDHRLPYPSIEAPGDTDFQDWTGKTLIGYPNTIFYDRRGEIVYAKQGPYTDAADLEADIEKYALSG